MLKLLSESYIFSVVVVINCNWRKLYIFFWKPGLAYPTLVLTWHKSSDIIPRFEIWVTSSTALLNNDARVDLRFSFHVFVFPSTLIARFRAQYARREYSAITTRFYSQHERESCLIVAAFAHTAFCCTRFSSTRVTRGSYRGASLGRTLRRRTLRERPCAPHETATSSRWRGTRWARACLWTTPWWRPGTTRNQNSGPRCHPFQVWAAFETRCFCLFRFFVLIQTWW